MKRIIALISITLIVSGKCFAQNRVKVLSQNLNSDTCHWNIGTDSIGIILASMTPLEGPTHHCCYNNLSCKIVGEVIYNGRKYNYSINAGGWANLWSYHYKQDFLLACTNTKFSKYFVSTYDKSGY